MWSELIEKAENNMPKFNSYLIDDFRKDKMEMILSHLPLIFKEAEAVLGGQVRYLGYKVCTPQERVQYIKKHLNSKWELNTVTDILVRIEFAFEDHTHIAHVRLPYMYGRMVHVAGSLAAPQFVIVERGGVNIIKHSVTVSLMKNTIRFTRTAKDYKSYSTVKGGTIGGIIVYTRIHNKASTLPPALVYILAKYGFDKTLEIFGYTEDDVTFTHKEKSSIDSNIDYVELENDILLKFNMTKAKEDFMFMRFITTLVRIYKRKIEYGIFNIKNSNCAKLLLGLFISNKNTNITETFARVNEHMESNNDAVDRLASERLASVGIQASNIYELIIHILRNIDEMVTSYSPTKLGNKKLASLELLMAPYAKSVFDKVLHMSNRKLVRNVVSSMSTSVSKNISSFVYDSNMFISIHDMANDNYLANMGLRRLRCEFINSRGKNNVPKEIILADDSQLWVEAINTIPASNPIVSGSINPFVEIDNNGCFIKTEYASYADGAFKLK